MPELNDVGELSRLCKALADELRLEILRLLKTESFGVLEICRILDIRQSALSHHLKILARAGLVSTRREGNSIFYRRPLILDSDPFADFKNSAFANIDRLSMPARTLKQVEVIHQERSQQSLDFFRRNAAKFREKQGLITEYQQYASSLEDLIAGISFNRQPVVMEVGPGAGELLLRLADRFERVIALDNSREMLDQARTTVENHQVDNVEFLFGDITQAQDQDLHCDLIILNMVLHHIPAPVEVFREARRLLNPSGVLLLVELISHDQDWVRESCGDLWLGFEGEDLSGWANEAGLVEGQSLYLGLRNGFQIQVRLFLNEGAAETVT
ncbi:MAG: metalloregulator ArsR/SmtB family transcription factor [Pseudomonadales bacterium]|nr:metalloregulator ArsR/SmtB family transcription factor [Pseudomonadales bacterium]MCP5347836.1 metalloregulator ArsR/SmtB family transcription factor [Pseudomonadales bacterium]